MGGTGSSQLAVIPGCAAWRRPGIHTPGRGYGFRARSLRSRPGMTKADLQIQRLAAAENAAFVERDARRSLAATPSVPTVAAAVEARMRARPTNQMRPKIN